MIRGVGSRRGLDPELLWLWYRPAATALIQPLAWEHPYATGVALKKQRNKKEEGRKENRRRYQYKVPLHFILQTPIE